MDDLIRAAREVQESLEQIGLPFCFIGGLANLHWGEPRLTQDIDVTVVVKLGEEEQTIDQLLSRIPPRFSDAREFALESRVLLLQSQGGVPVDLALGALSFEDTVTSRAKHIDFAGHNLKICSAEDLVVLKAFANRPRDWSDIEGVILRQKHKLDFRYVFEQLEDLASSKPEQPIVRTLKTLLEGET